MPKMKTNKGAAKRFRFTKTGKIKRARAGRRHLLTGKSRRRKQHMRRRTGRGGSGAKLIRRLLPYG